MGQGYVLRDDLKDLMAVALLTGSTGKEFQTEEAETRKCTDSFGLAPVECGWMCEKEVLKDLGIIKMHSPTGITTDALAYGYHNICTPCRYHNICTPCRYHNICTPLWVS